MSTPDLELDPEAVALQRATALHAVKVVWAAHQAAEATLKRQKKALTASMKHAVGIGVSCGQIARTIGKPVMTVHRWTHGRNDKPKNQKGQGESQ